MRWHLRSTPLDESMGTSEAYTTHQRTSATWGGVDATDSLLTHLKPRCLVTSDALVALGEPVVWNVAGASFHFVLSGDCTITADAGEEISLARGDFVVLLHGGVWNLRRTLQPRFDAAASRLEACRVASGVIKWNGGDMTPLLSAMRSFRATKLGRDNAVLANIVPLIEDELAHKKRGRMAVVNLMLTVVAVEAIREQLTSLPPNANSWLRALQDEDLGPALTAMLHDPGHPWTIEKLADRGYMARSTFARRFREAVGESPMNVLTDIRMQIAKELLLTSSGLKSISVQVGYGSLSSFTSAFRRRFALTPTQFRRIKCRQK